MQMAPSGRLCGRNREESPDRKGHFTAESADRGNLVVNVTENNRISPDMQG